MSELIRVSRLSKTFTAKDWRGRKSTIKAVSEVNLTLNKGETLGLVGESGSGKTTLGRLVLNLENPTSGKIFYDGKDMSAVNAAERKKLNRKMQIIFQDPYSALNPRLTAVELVMEPLLGVPKKLARQKAIDTLAIVGITGDAVNKFPDQARCP